MSATPHLDARLLRAFHAVDIEDLSIILRYVERMAEKRTRERSIKKPSQPPLKLIAGGKTEEGGA